MNWKVQLAICMHENFGEYNEEMAETGGELVTVEKSENGMELFATGGWCKLVFFSYPETCIYVQFLGISLTSGFTYHVGCNMVNFCMSHCY